MRYTVTTVEEKRADVSPETCLAIGEFKRVRSLEKRLERAEKILAEWVAQIPEKDMEAYMEVTTEMCK